MGELHAVLLTGGSAPGLGAAAGVLAFLREGGLGYRPPMPASPWWRRPSSTTWAGQRRRPARGPRTPTRRRPQPRAGGRGGLGGSGHRSDRGQDPRGHAGMMKGGVGWRLSIGGTVGPAESTVSAPHRGERLGDVLRREGACSRARAATGGSSAARTFCSRCRARPTSSPGATPPSRSS